MRAEGLESRLLFNADHLVFIQQPVDTHAGVTVLPPVIVDVDNSSPGIDSTNQSSITLTISAGPLNGTTAVAAFNGVAGFNDLSVPSPGVYRLYASAAGMKTITSNLFTISPPLHLAFFRQPTGSIAGSGLGAVTVDVEDPDGNIVTTDESIVTLSANGGSLGGATTAQVVNGVAVFNTVAETAAGSFTLTAMDGNDAPATSNPFNVGPGPVLPSAVTPVIEAATLPAVEISADREIGMVTIDLVNQTQSPQDGRISLALYLTSDGQIDNSSVKLVATARHVNLVPGATAIEFLQVTSFPYHLPDGSYTILAQAIDPAGNASVSASGATVLLPAPFTQLQTAVGALGQAKIHPGNLDTVGVTITNEGNAVFSGPIELTLGLSIDDQTDAYPLRSASRTLRLGAGASVTLTLQFVISKTQPAASYLPFVSITDNGNTTPSVGGSVLTVV